MKVALDTNILVLLIGGLTDRQLLGKYKRLRSFTTEDFDLLLSTLEDAQQIVVTPHVLAEASNLLGSDDDPTGRKLRGKLAQLLKGQEERHVHGHEIVDHPHFLRLGIADCGLLSILDRDTALLTADLALYLTAVQTHAATMNFNHLRPSAWT